MGMPRYKAVQPEGRRDWAILDCEQNAYVLGANGQQRRFRDEESAVKVMKYLETPNVADRIPIRRTKPTPV